MALILLVCKLAHGSALCFIFQGNDIPHLRERLAWGVGGGGCGNLGLMTVLNCLDV